MLATTMVILSLHIMLAATMVILSLHIVLAATMVILSQNIMLASTMVILSQHMHVRVDGLQLHLASISLIPTLHVLSRTKTILTDASNFDGCQAFLLVSTVSMD